MSDAENKPYWRSVFYKSSYNDIFNAIIYLSETKGIITISDVYHEVDLNYGQVLRRINMMYASGIIKKICRGYYKLEINVWVASILNER